jgi:hypothetical protein
MRNRNGIAELIKILQGKASILPGSLNRLIQKREEGGRRAYWYLTWKEEGRSRAIYIPAGDVRQVSRGIKNMKRLKLLISNIAEDNLRGLREGRDVRKRR